MYLEERAVKATLRSISKLAESSLVAFDYLSRELVEGKALFRFIGTPINASIAASYGERFVFGISTRPPARRELSAYLPSESLELERYEPLGEGRGAEPPIGGFALAARRG